MSRRKRMLLTGRRKLLEAQAALIMVNTCYLPPDASALVSQALVLLDEAEMLMRGYLTPKEEAK